MKQHKPTAGSAVPDYATLKFIFFTKNKFENYILLLDEICNIKTY
jgi:hypothetical protein